MSFGDDNQMAEAVQAIVNRLDDAAICWVKVSNNQSINLKQVISVLWEEKNSTTTICYLETVKQTYEIVSHKDGDAESKVQAIIANFLEGAELTGI